MVLNKIVQNKLREVALQKKKLPFSKIRALTLKNKRKINSLSRALTKPSGRPHLICEMKKASPSEGVIRRDFDVKQISKSFIQGGASAFSILTDQKFFQGHPKYLELVKSRTNKPILRKDFILDEYQVYESKLMGADVILLIVAILDQERLNQLQSLARYLGLEVITEIHSESELDRALQSGASMIGINNRNLDTLKVKSTYAKKIIRRIPKNILKIVESGIHSAKDIQKYKGFGVDGFLVGTALMKSNDIGGKIKSLRGIK